MNLIPNNTNDLETFKKNVFSNIQNQRVQIEAFKEDLTNEYIKFSEMMTEQMMQTIIDVKLIDNLKGIIIVSKHSSKSIEPTVYKIAPRGKNKINIEIKKGIHTILKTSFNNSDGKIKRMNYAKEHVTFNLDDALENPIFRIRLNRVIEAIRNYVCEDTAIRRKITQAKQIIHANNFNVFEELQFHNEENSKRYYFSKEIFGSDNEGIKTFKIIFYSKSTNTFHAKYTNFDNEEGKTLNLTLNEISQIYKTHGLTRRF